MGNDPADWHFSGPNDTVPSMAVDGPPPSTPRYPRHLGYRAEVPSGSGCGHTEIFALTAGRRAPI